MTRPFLYCRALVFKTKVIGYHSNKFRVCGLSAAVLNCVSEVGVQRINVTSVPSNLNSMSDSAFYTGGCGLISLCNSGVEHLCYGIYHLVTEFITSLSSMVIRIAVLRY